MAKKKLVHFKENLTFPHLFQPHYSEIIHGSAMRSHWGETFFGNDHPIVLELGCGKGEYTVGLALKFPGRNFIGIDVKGARLWRGAKTVQEQAIGNVAFIRQRVDFLELFFGKGEVSEIWITFPDPQQAKERKRLTSPGFLEKYRNVLVTGGIIHLKTDDAGFFEYTLQVIKENDHKILFMADDLYHSGCDDEPVSIRTFYEKKWLEQDKKICYVKFSL